MKGRCIVGVERILLESLGVGFGLYYVDVYGVSIYFGVIRSDLFMGLIYFCFIFRWGLGGDWFGFGGGGSEKGIVWGYNFECIR